MKLATLLVLVGTAFAQLPIGGITSSAPPPVHTFSFAHANTNTSCAAHPSTTCTVTTTSTTAGSLLVIWLTANSTSATMAISSVTCSPNACNSGASAYVHCTNCNFRNTNSDTVDGGYILSAPSGITSVVVNYADGQTDKAFSIAEVDEITYTGGGNSSKDSTGGAALTTCTSCAVTGLTLTGTKDYISRDFNTSSSPTAPGSPWTNPANIATTGVIGALNQTAAATFNVAQTSGVVAQAVMAFQ